ncbi:MAG: methyltransferase domain-containing protein [Alphaproteobacteria bacterium]
MSPAAERARLVAALRVAGHEVVPSEAGFVCIELRRPVAPVVEALIVQGFAAAAMVAPGHETCLRVVVSTADANDALVQALAALDLAWPKQPRTVLHVGCGRDQPGKLHQEFRTDRWREIRLDIDTSVAPDIVASMTDMSPVGDASHDALYSSHTLEHLYWHDVPVALAEFRRVLRPQGMVLLRLPDLEEACKRVAAGASLLDPLYESQVGPINALDMIFGYQKFLRDGNAYMAHRCGFSRQTLRDQLEAAGFASVEVHADKHMNLWGRAWKPLPEVV